MTEIRRRFHDELKSLESNLIDMAGHVDVMLRDAVRALVTRDHSGVRAVIDHDDIVDDLYMSVESRWHEVMAMQTPVAVDLRLMSAMIHINAHLERMADVAVNIAKTARKTRKLPATEVILTHIGEMGDIARNMIRTAMEAFATRDLDRALSLPAMDDDVDRLNKRMYREVVKCDDDAELLEWAIRMMVISRYLERVGDHAVHIAEHVAFLLTGEFREFDDAS
ncbi:phosphate signaling complex protein PhoU [Actinomycetota bacterium]